VTPGDNEVAAKGLLGEVRWSGAFHPLLHTTMRGLAERVPGCERGVKGQMSDLGMKCPIRATQSPLTVAVDWTSEGACISPFTLHS
jgi:hypothetical protein